jgi:hypothetical protein
MWKPAAALCWQEDDTGVHTVLAEQLQGYGVVTGPGHAPLAGSRKRGPVHYTCT